MALAETAKLAVLLSLKDGLTPGIKKATGALGAFDRGSGRTLKGVGQVGKGLARVGVIAAGAAAAGIAVVTKRFIDWEDALVGVAKTLDAPPEKIDAIGKGLRAMALEIPTAANELAAIAEAGGQMGIAADDILEFTRTVAVLGATTNLSTDQAAVGLGQLQNIIHLTAGEFDNFASALVDLGNKGNSTESQILEVARRAGGAARLIGVAKKDTLGWAAAAANLGLQQELAGSSLQRFFLISQRTITHGGAGLRTMAKVAGQTGDAFKKAFKEDATGALESFLRGLSQLSPSRRQNVIESIFGKQTGITRLILGLADSIDQNLVPALDNGRKAWDENTAAQEEFQRRVADVKSKITLLGNGLNEAALLIGEGIAPAIGKAADKLSEFLKLPSTRTALKDLGRNIGDALDSIDWNKVLGFAQTLVAAFKPGLALVKQIADIITKLPPELLGAGAGLVVTNKLSGGLLFEGGKNILGGLGESLGRNFLASITGGTLGALPVRVVNWGGLPGVGGGGPNLLPATGLLAPGAVTLLGGVIATSIAPYLLIQAHGSFGAGAASRPLQLPNNGGTLNAQQVGFFQGLMPQFTQLALKAGATSVAPKVSAVQRGVQILSAITRALSTRQAQQLGRLNVRQQQTVAHIDQQKNRLANLQQRLHNARENHETARAARLRQRIQTVKADIDRSNAKLERIARKKMHFTTKVTVNTSTRISGAEVVRRVSQSRTSKKTLSVSKGYSGP